MNYDRQSVGQSVLVSSSRPDINYYLTVTVFFSMSFVLVTWTASVQFSKFAAGPCQHSIYLSVFIIPGERVAQLYPQALGSSGTLGVPFPVPTIVGPWGWLTNYWFWFPVFSFRAEPTENTAYNSSSVVACCGHVMVTDHCIATNGRLIMPSHVYHAIICFFSLQNSGFEPSCLNIVE
jgi:hypothetical protein